MRLLSSMSADSIRSFINSGFRYFVAEIGGTMAGVVATRDDQHLYHLFVDNQFQRQGLAGKLWRVAHAACVAARGNCASSRSTLPATRWRCYERFGFVRHGETQQCWRRRLCSHEAHCSIGQLIAVLQLCPPSSSPSPTTAPTSSAGNGSRSGGRVQEELEKAIERITQQKTRCVASGRTDSGVHALGQVVCFRSDTNLDGPALCKGAQRGTARGHAGL